MFSIQAVKSICLAFVIVLDKDKERNPTTEEYLYLQLHISKLQVHLKSLFQLGPHWIQLK